jgi:hypothetical protein
MTKHSFEIVATVDNIDALLLRLGRWIDRRRPKNPTAIIADEDVPASFDPYLPGHHYGRYDEVIVRREVRSQGTPDWFDPRVTPGQFGIIGRDGVRIYIQVRLDVEKRDEPSTFDREVLTLVERPVEQTSLF